MYRLFHALVSPLASAAFLSSSLRCLRVLEPWSLFLQHVNHEMTIHDNANIQFNTVDEAILCKRDKYAILASYKILCKLF